MRSMARQTVIRVFAGCLGLLLLSACETFGPTGQQSLDMDERARGEQASYSPFNWSPPNYAGLTAGRIVYPGKDGAPPVVAEWLSGKEAENATITFATPDGNVITYSAGGLRAGAAKVAVVASAPRWSATWRPSSPICGRTSPRRSAAAWSTPSASMSPKVCAASRCGACPACRRPGPSDSGRFPAWSRQISGG